MSDEIADWVRLLNDKQNPYLDLMRVRRMKDDTEGHAVPCLWRHGAASLPCRRAIAQSGLRVQQSQQVPFIHTVDTTPTSPRHADKSGDLPDDIHRSFEVRRVSFVRERLEDSRIQFNDRTKAGQEFYLYLAAADRASGGQVQVR